MDFFDLIRSRYSVRAYKSEPVEIEKLEQILDAARLAPTAANRQPFKLIVIHTKGKEAALREIYHREWFSQAPLVICICGIPSRGWSRDDFDGANYTVVDAAIVFDHLTLAATSLGLGTCWVAHFNPNTAREFLGLPAGVEPIVFSPLGYPADQPKPKVRRPLDDLVKYEKW